MAGLQSAVEKMAQSSFMTKLQTFSQKMASNAVFSTLSNGMGATMGLIMIGAVVQIACAIMGLCGIEPTNAIYVSIYRVYEMSMGMLAVFMSFSLAYNYARKMKMEPLQSGFIALVCFLLVVSPVQRVELADGSTMSVLNFGNMGASNIFVAILVGLLSVRVSKFVKDHNWIIKMPDSVPEGVMAGFNAIIPSGINIAIWYGLAELVQVAFGTTLSYLIIGILSIPIGYLVSPLGMCLVLALSQTFWFFGIHGTSVAFSVMLVPMMAAYATNAELAAAGEPLVWNAIFLISANGMVGGAGNTLPLVVMGYNSKSDQIRQVSRASLIPGLFGINEPVIFGMPMMYNALYLIPFILSPVVVLLLMWGAYSLHLIAYPYVLIMSCLPLLLDTYLATMDWKNVVFKILMFPVCWVIWYPFYKMYEKQCVANEAAAREAEAAASAGVAS